jgi:hypothetical protein
MNTEQTKDCDWCCQQAIKSHGFNAKEEALRTKDLFAFTFEKAIPFLRFLDACEDILQSHTLTDG